MKFRKPRLATTTYADKGCSTLSSLVPHWSSLWSRLSSLAHDCIHTAAEAEHQFSATRAQERHVRRNRKPSWPTLFGVYQGTNPKEYRRVWTVFDAGVSASVSRIQDVLLPPPTDLERTFNDGIQYLDHLLKVNHFSNRDYQRAKFFLFVGRCDQGAVRLVSEHPYLHDAIRVGYNTGELSESEARIAAFCLLVDRGPSEARRCEADKDLPSAVKNALDWQTKTHHGLAKCIEASLFPIGTNAHEIEIALSHNYPDVEDMDTVWDRYLLEFFKRQTGCDSDDEAKLYLDDNNWLMAPATQEYRRSRLAAPQWSHVESFDTVTPPDVQPDSIVVGLLGTVDGDFGEDLASPYKDDWFVSDSYLWKHVLGGMGSSQTWITCLDPKDLVQKYASRLQASDTDTNSWDEGYLHGRPTEERVIVLDKSNLNFAAENLQVFEQKRLLDEYLRLLDSKFSEAQAAGQPLVLLIFGHGDIESYGNRGGLFIGVANAHMAKESEFFSAKMIADIHDRYPEVKLALFMRSCYSGYWVTTPYFNSKKANVISATRSDEQSHSWKNSSSMRHAGGIFSSGFLEELKTEPTEFSESYKAREYEEFVHDLAARVERLNVSDPKKGMASLPSFTAATNHEKFYQRTGYALYDYQVNYDRLRRTSPSKEEGSTARAGSYNESNGSYGELDRNLHQAVSYLVHKYEVSFPTNTGSDRDVQYMIRHFHQKKLDGDSQNLRKLQALLTFRSSRCDLATKIVNLMALNVGAATPIADWDPHQELENRDRVNQIVTKLKTETDWFKRKTQADGISSYEKPYLYVAHAMAVQHQNDKQVSQLIAHVKKAFKEEVAIGSKRARGAKSWSEAKQEYRLRKDSP